MTTICRDCGETDCKVAWARDWYERERERLERERPGELVAPVGAVFDALEKAEARCRETRDQVWDRYIERRERALSEAVRERPHESPPPPPPPPAVGGDEYVEVQDADGNLRGVARWAPGQYSGTWVMRMMAKLEPPAPPTTVGLTLPSGWWLTLFAPPRTEVPLGGVPDSVRREAIVELSRGLAEVQEDLPRACMPADFAVTLRSGGAQLRERRRRVYQERVVRFETLGEARDVGLALVTWALEQMRAATR